jgi:biopolymer transport protein TolQ
MNSTFSIMWLFTHGDLMTRFISVVLALASVGSWAIIIEKWFILRNIRLQSAVFERKFWSGGSLDDLYGSMKSKGMDPMAQVFIGAMKEWKKSSSLLKSAKNKNLALDQRIERVMDLTIEREVSKLEERTDILSMIGSTAPLLGLFGTVWGIMQAFGAIGDAQSTSIAVLAPGVATSLATTALGLICAIPAVIGYNKIYNEILKYNMKLESFAGEFNAIVSRQIDETVNG